MRPRSLTSATLVFALASCAPHPGLCTVARRVFVNGTQVIKDGEHTGAKPERAVWGPGKVH